jgi:hypothetical protein
LEKGTFKTLRPSYSNGVMAKKSKKRKIAKPVPELYEIEVDDWEMNYHFGINEGERYIFSGDYREESYVIFFGRIISPILKRATKAHFHVSGDPNLDDHYKEDAPDKSPSGIGHMQVLRDNETLALQCNVPSRSIPFIAVSAGHGKIKHVSVYGDKLRWGRGNIAYISMRTRVEED